MIPRIQTKALIQISRCSKLSNNILRIQKRSISLESLTTPFNRYELHAAATGNPNLDADYYLVYIGIPLPPLTTGPLARRIATYKIGAFLLSACGMALAPVVAATAQVPIMALPGTQLYD
jgi:hypothetical protein